MSTTTGVQHDPHHTETKQEAAARVADEKRGTQHERGADSVTGAHVLPVARENKGQTLERLVVLLAADWVRGDKHHYDQIRERLLKLLDDFGDQDPFAAAALSRLLTGNELEPDGRRLGLEQGTARAQGNAPFPQQEHAMSGTQTNAQKKNEAIAKAQQAVQDAAQHGTQEQKDAAAAALKRAQNLPD